MAEQKVKVTDGRNTWVVTTAEYADMEANRPASMPKLTVVGDAPIESVYENARGELAREGLTPEQVARRAQFGQEVAATPERIEQHRQQEQRRLVEEIADDSNITALTNAALPGAQAIQNLLVGKDAAAEARQQLAVNFIPNLAGNLAEFAIGGKALSLGFKGLLGAERAAKLGTKMGFGKEASALARAGRVATGEAAVESHFYAQSLLDHNQEFVAEDWARQVGTGLLLGSPFVAGAAARGVGQAARRGLQAAGADVPGVLSTVGDAMTVGAVLSPVGHQAQRYARGAAAYHVGGRVYRKLFKKGKGRGLGATDEAAQAQLKHLDDMDHVGGLTPERLDRMSPSKRRAYIEDFKPLADGDVSFLDEVPWGTLNKRTRAMGTKVAGVRNQILGIHRRFKGDGVKVKMSDAARNRALTEANVVMKYVDEAGLEDVRGAVQRSIVDGGADPSAMVNALFEARVNARFRRGVTGGADVVDDSLKSFLEDSTIWGAAQTKKFRRINEAIDDTVAVWDELGGVHIPKHLEEVSVNDALHMQAAKQGAERLRGNMNTLRNEGLLSEAQVRGIETKLVDADAAIVDGSKAYGDIVKINRARQSASAKLGKEAEINSVDIPTSPESFAAQKASMVAETAGDLLNLGAKGIDALLDTRSQIFAARGVLGLHAMSEDDKRGIFEAIQRELPTLTGNPQYAITAIGKTLDRGAALDPVGADMAGAKMVNTMYWLASQMPKADDTIYGRLVPQPLSEVEDYLEKHVAAYDPLSVGFAALQGRVTQGMVDAVRVTSPALYAQMGVVFSETLAAVPAEKANPKVVNGIGMFLGVLDPMYTGNFLMQLQSSYAQTATQDGVIRGGVNNMPNNNSPQDPRSGATQAQRLSG